MKIGDLVIRIWYGRKMWDMIGIIINKQYINNHLELGDGEWKFEVDWGEIDTMILSSNTSWPRMLLWDEKEIEVISESW